jgi:hypothetical protein
LHFIYFLDAVLFGDLMLASCCCCDVNAASDLFDVSSRKSTKTEKNTLNFLNLLTDFSHPYLVVPPPPPSPPPSVSLSAAARTQTNKSAGAAVASLQHQLASNHGVNVIAARKIIPLSESEELRNVTKSSSSISFGPRPATETDKGRKI